MFWSALCWSLIWLSCCKWYMICGIISFLCAIYGIMFFAFVGFQMLLCSLILSTIRGLDEIASFSIQ